MTFGQQVKVTATLQRRYNPLIGFVDCRGWDRVELKEPRVGPLVGRRALATGVYYCEEGSTAEAPLAEVLVVFAEQSELIVARPEDVEEVSEWGSRSNGQETGEEESQPAARNPS